ncbi:hypothetical protein FHW96_003623 [Novosphingobium sp. SG751A]|uniref:DUF6644 family protein n=1 Tax=Novosphingobium sp. SG751A TaxID=2587000 RepID=UPI0015573BC2|nr:DUF6644 family protein [Novosphingobium sp. SG751A]NOW47443.1 hypothetical protein [Novosphingobium sp. SG751A]
MGLIEVLAQWLYDTDWATAIRESEVVFPAIETVHVLALALMVGTIALVDLRLLGAALREAPAAEVERRIVPVTWAGFAVMAVSGFLLFASEAAKIIHNPAFIIKFAAMVLAGLNVALFHWRAKPLLLAVPVGGPVPVPAQVAAAVSLGLWLVVIAAGRAVAYF